MFTDSLLPSPLLSPSSSLSWGTIRSLIHIPASFAPRVVSRVDTIRGLTTEIRLMSPPLALSNQFKPPGITYVRISSGQLIPGRYVPGSTEVPTSLQSNVTQAAPNRQCISARVLNSSNSHLTHHHEPEPHDGLRFNLDTADLDQELCCLSYLLNQTKAPRICVQGMLGC